MEQPKDRISQTYLTMILVTVQGLISSEIMDDVTPLVEE